MTPTNSSGILVRNQRYALRYDVAVSRISVIL